MINVDNTKETDYLNDREPDYSEYASNNYSECCGAMVYAETDICSDCQEHCDIEGEGEETPEETNDFLRNAGF